MERDTTCTLEHGMCRRTICNEFIFHTAFFCKLVLANGCPLLSSRVSLLPLGYCQAFLNVKGKTWTKAAEVNQNDLFTMKKLQQVNRKFSVKAAAEVKGEKISSMIEVYSIEKIVQVQLALKSNKPQWDI